jgi:hypothetical protein
MCQYILHIKDNLLITVNDSSPNDHNDLLIHIFNQLTASSIESFADKIKEIYIDYSEAKLPNRTPDVLMKKADDKTHVLKHAGQWTDAEPPAVMAVKLQLDSHQATATKTKTQLVAHIGQLERRHHWRSAVNTLQHPDKHGKCTHTDGPSYNYPAWMITPPRTNNEVKVMN